MFFCVFFLGNSLTRSEQVPERVASGLLNRSTEKRRKSVNAGREWQSRSTDPPPGAREEVKQIQAGVAAR